MAVDRRRFLKIAGLAALGAAGRPCLNAFAAAAGGEAQALGLKRWAMVLDLQACTSRDGCRKCIEACHQAHNVPDFRDDKGEVIKKDEVKWIWTEPFEHAFPTEDHPFVKPSVREQPILVLCNHCDNPPCVRVCPTKATFRREDGIVMMDYHRCIGCRYCVAACPYGSRSFNWRDPRPFIKKERFNRNFPTRTRGVVEKCNFCAERLERGLLPACVEACPEKALLFGDLEVADSDVRAALKDRYAIRRKPELGTRPEVYYLV